MVNKGQDHVAEKQQTFTFTGVGHIGKLVGRDVELLCKDLPIAICFAILSVALAALIMAFECCLSGAAVGRRIFSFWGLTFNS